MIYLGVRNENMENIEMEKVRVVRDELRAFDFTDAEEKIVETLSFMQNVSVSKLSRKADVPRTTVYSALLRLKERGFVRRVRKGQRSLWKLKKISNIKNIVEDGIEHLTPEDEISRKGIVGGVDAKEVGIGVYRGKRQILKAYEKMFELGKAERFFVVQGNESVKNTMKNIDKQYLFSFRDRFRKAHIIMEAFSGEFVMKALKALPKEELKSHSDRMLIATLIEDEFMDFGLDLVVIKDQMLLIDVKREVVVSIRNHEIANMVHCFCQFFQKYGRHINYNKEVKKMIEDKDKL